MFGSATGLVDMMTQCFPSSRDGSAMKVERHYTGPQDSQIAESMRGCNPSGPLMIYIAKLFPKPDCSKFDVFGRILSGTLVPGQKVCFSAIRRDSYVHVYPFWHGSVLISA